MGAREAFVEALAREAYRPYLRPPPVLSCHEWADRYRRIAKGPEPGPWRTDRTPYLREPMACTDPEHPCQKVVLMFATQLGKSDSFYNALFKRIHLQPVDMMMVQPTLQDAKDHSRQRFTPTVRLMPEVEAKLPPPRSRDEQNTWQTKEIRGGATLFFAGANSARSLASKPLGFVVCDEIDGYPLDVDGEGDPLWLVWERMSNFPRRKMLVCSTPTVRGVSRIEAEYLASDRRRYWLPCAHCAGIQVLRWGADKEYGIKWLKTAAGAPRADTAVYVCEHCGAAIEERHKPSMLHDGRWIAEEPDAQRGLVVGFHLSKLYSPLGWKTWAMLVEDWTKAQQAAAHGDDSKLKSFVNLSLAETYEEQGDKANEHELRQRAEDIQRRVVQWGMYVRTISVDVQDDRLELFDWAWGRGMESQLVERDVIYGDPSLSEGQEGSPWNRVTEYRRTPVLHASKQPAQLLATFIDSGGHHTQAVYVYCREHQREHVHACKGTSIAGKAVLGKPTSQDVSWRGMRVKRGVKLWPIGTDTAKSAIYNRLRIARPGPGYIHLSREMPGEVFEQLTSERLVTRYVKGRPKLEWVKPPGRRNEALDGAVYALAAAHYAGLDRWQEPDWSRAERRVSPATKPAPAVDKAAERPPAAPLPPAPAPAQTAASPKRRRRGVFVPSGMWR